MHEETGELPPSLTRSSTAVFGAIVASASMSFLFVVAVARATGPATRGALAFLTAVPLLLGYASTLGLESAILYFAGRDAKSRGGLLAPSLANGAVTGLALAAGAWLIFSFQPHWVPAQVSRPLLLLALTTTPFVCMVLLLHHALIGSEQIRAANIVRIVISAT
jgi:O-antigen/teichoic acid export membrane protein